MKKILSSIALLLLTSTLWAAPELAAPDPVLPAQSPLQIIVPFQFIDNTSDGWNKIESYLRSNDLKPLKLIWAGVGGTMQVSKLFQSALTAAMQKGKDVQIEVAGAASSAHAYAICGTKNVVFTPGSSLMFHAGSMYYTYLFDTIAVKTTALSPSDQFILLQQIAICHMNGYITSDDIDVILSGGEVTYLYKNSADRVRIVTPPVLAKLELGYEIYVLGMPVEYFVVIALFIILLVINHRRIRGKK